MCVFLGVRAFQYVSVNESRHVRVTCKCDCQKVYMHLYVIMNKFAIVVIHYGPLKKPIVIQNDHQYELLHQLHILFLLVFFFSSLSCSFLYAGEYS